MQPETLEHQIYQDLKTKILRGEPFEYSLTLHNIAEAYECSTRPVRSAFSRLVQDSFILQNNGGRMQVSPKKFGKKPNAKSNLQNDDLEAVITKDLVEASLHGIAIQFTEQGLADYYKIGRTRLRAMLQRISGKGILNYLPRIGWRLRPFSQKELENFGSVRRELELLALRQSFNILEKNVIEQMIITTEALFQDKGKEDNSLHDYFVKQSDNTFIINFMNQNLPYFELLFDWESLDETHARKAVTEHLRILKAILMGDLIATEKVLLKHLAYDHTRILAERQKLKHPLLKIGKILK